MLRLFRWEPTDPRPRVWRRLLKENSSTYPGWVFHSHLGSRVSAPLFLVHRGNRGEGRGEFTMCLEVGDSLYQVLQAMCSILVMYFKPGAPLYLRFQTMMHHFFMFSRSTCSTMLYAQAAGASVLMCSNVGAPFLFVPN